jgi:hypothetical protein
MVELVNGKVVSSYGGGVGQYILEEIRCRHLPFFL